MIEIGNCECHHALEVSIFTLVQSLISLFFIRLINNCMCQQLTIQNAPNVDQSRIH